MVHLRPLALIAIASLALSLAPRPTAADESPAFELKDGDRVVLLGGTFIDREQHDGYIETGLVSRFPGRKITFRNIGWDGDTVFEQHRPENFGSMMEHLRRLRPTVLIASYGTMESERGVADLVRFAARYNELLENFAKTGARIVLMSPFPREPGTDAAGADEHNRSLAAYVSAIGRIAQQRHLPFVDLSQVLVHRKGNPPLWLTDNGVHLSALGYWRASPEVARGLGLPPTAWQLEVEGSKVKKASGTSVRSIEKRGGKLRFELLDAQLPSPPAPQPHPKTPLAWTPERTLQITGFAPGRYQLSIDGKPIASGRHEAWRQYPLVSGPEFEQAEQLRKAIVEKNELFFFRFRPHNGEYVYGRRSKTFSSNSGNEQFPAEMAKLDELIAAADARIAKLAIPVAHRYELVRIDEAN